MNELFNSIYKNKKVLITGHSGFKGSWLTLFLQKMGATIIGYSLKPNTEPNHINLIDTHQKNVYGDIRDLKKLKSIITQEKPDIIFHLAAQSLVLKSYDDPVDTFDTNIMGTVNLLEACKESDSVKAIIVITSDKCYHNNEWMWSYRENDPLGGKDPYSASKACSEIVTASYRDSFFSIKEYKKSHNTLIATARAGNVIGGGDWAENRLIPDIVKATIKDSLVTIRNPNSVRPWQHVLEPLYGYLLLGNELLNSNADFAQSWNFGPSENENLNVKNMLEQIKQYWKTIDYKIITQNPKFNEANLLKLDSSKANQLLNWKPILNIQQALFMTINWYHQYYMQKQVISSQQLEYYITLANQQHASRIKDENNNLATSRCCHN